MAYKQLLVPDFSTMSDAGWCLWFVEEAYRVSHLYATAEDAWRATTKPHPNEQPPNLMVPVYWTYFDVTENIEFGHIAIFVPGRGVFTSPFNRAYGNEWYSSIQAMTNRINQIDRANARYLGWSEDLAGSNIILKEEEMPTQQQVLAEFRYWGVPDPTQSQLTSYSNLPWANLYYDLGRYNYDRRKELEAQADGKFVKVDFPVFKEKTT